MKRKQWIVPLTRHADLAERWACTERRVRNLINCERAQIDAHLAQRRFMLVDPANRLVADSLEREWNDKLRALANAQEEREPGRQEDQFALDDAIRDRLIAMASDFAALWSDPSLPNRERKRLLAYIIKDVTLAKLAVEGTTKIHVRFKRGKTEILTTQNPKSSARRSRPSRW